jgi:hypothetical protein
MTPPAATLPKQVSVPRQPVEDFLRTSIDDLEKLIESEEQADRRATLRAIRHRHRSHLAAFLLISDQGHNAKIQRIVALMESGADLGPAMTLDEFDQEFAVDEFEKQLPLS